MDNTDFDGLRSHLLASWPGKYSDQDVRYWIKDLAPWQFDNVVEMLVKFKNEKKFCPKTREIKEACQQRWPVQVKQQERQAARFITVVARQWAHGHPQYANDPESSLIMRYYRFWFCRMRKSITDVADKRKGNEQALLPDDAVRIDNAKRKCVRDCLSELLACGLTWEEADAASSWIDSTDLEFDQAIESLRSLPAREAQPA